MRLIRGDRTQIVIVHVFKGWSCDRPLAYNRSDGERRLKSGRGKRDLRLYRHRWCTIPCGDWAV